MPVRLEMTSFPCALHLVIVLAALDKFLFFTESWAAVVPDFRYQAYQNGVGRGMRSIGPDSSPCGSDQSPWLPENVVFSMDLNRIMVEKQPFDSPCTRPVVYIQNRGGIPRPYQNYGWMGNEDAMYANGGMGYPGPLPDLPPECCFYDPNPCPSDCSSMASWNPYPMLPQPFNPWPPQQPGEPGLGGPVDPVNPVDPIKPVDPVDPIKPVDPVEPVKPVIPCSVPGWLRLPDGRKLYLSEVGDWTWHKAEAKATEKKAKLAKIISADENEKLAQILSSCYPDGTKVWLGGNDLANPDHWSWTDGEPIGSYQNFGQGQGHCLSLTVPSESWNKEDCSENKDTSFALLKEKEEELSTKPLPTEASTSKPVTTAVKTTIKMSTAGETIATTTKSGPGVPATTAASGTKPPPV